MRRETMTPQHFHAFISYVIITVCNGIYLLFNEYLREERKREGSDEQKCLKGAAADWRE